MYDENNEKIKDYIYINNRLIDNYYYQIFDKNIFKLILNKFVISLKISPLSITNREMNYNYIEKIKILNDHFEKNNLFKEPSDNLIYNEGDYFCKEYQKLVKILLKNSKIKTKYNIKKIFFYISVDRTFTKFGNNSPLFLLSENLNVNNGMDGSSGYSTFKLLMEDYLKCKKDFIKQIDDNMKSNFAKDPIKFFKELGCNISDERHFETIYKKRAILKDDKHNIVCTFAYPFYIATST